MDIKRAEIVCCVLCVVLPTPPTACAAHTYPSILSKSIINSVIESVMVLRCLPINSIRRVASC